MGLLERHPDLYESAMNYEKPDAGFTWQQGESLEDIRQPERIELIRANDAKRAAQAAARRKPKNLAEAFGAIELADDDESGCLICHL